MMEGNLMNVMEKQAGVGGTMNRLSDKISALMDMIAQTHIQTGQAPGSHTMTIATHSAAEEDNTQHSPSSEYSNRQLDRVSFSSTIKKKYRTGCTETEVGDAGVRQQVNDQHGYFGNSQTHSSSIIKTQTSEALEHHDLDSPAPLSQAAQTPLPDNNNTDPLLQATTKLDDINTALESRYKEKLSQLSQIDQSNDQTLQDTLADITADLEARYNTTNAPGSGDAT